MVKLNACEKKRLADSFTAQVLALGLKPDAALPRDVKKRVRSQVLCSIRAERLADGAKKTRRQTYEAAENTFVWAPVRRR